MSNNPYPLLPSSQAELSRLPFQVGFIPFFNVSVSVSVFFFFLIQCMLGIFFLFSYLGWIMY